VESAITVVIFAVVGISGLIAIATLFMSASPRDGIGGGTLLPPSQEPAEMREDDVRQMLEARNRRRVARGEQPGDVERELQDLLSPASAMSVGDEVEAEARALIASRNARHRRRGEPEEDVEAEVAALLRQLGG
jgi:hypothetical protein